MIAATVAAAAGVTAFVVMMIAMEISFDLERTVDVRFGNFADIAGGSADDLDADITQRIDRAAADAAANQHFDLLHGKHHRQCAVTGASAGKLLFTANKIILYFKHRKSRCMSEVLKNLMVFTSYSNFHNTNQFYLLLLS